MTALMLRCLNETDLLNALCGEIVQMSFGVFESHSLVF